MRVVQLTAENFKRLQAVEITPEGNVVEITGKNGSGKSSVLDAIFVALVGRSVAPPKPVRNGEQRCTIKLDLGELVVTRTFTNKEGGGFEDSIKVENEDGLRFGKPQSVLDALLGEIGFDPFEFVQMKAEDQAKTLLEMVPLEIDIDKFAELDTSDYAKRRDINRDVGQVKSQIALFPTGEPAENLPDRQALEDQLASAATTNSGIERDRLTREATQRNLDALQQSYIEKRARRDELRAEAALLDTDADKIERDHANASAEFAKLDPLPEPVDTDAIRTQLREATDLLRIAGEQRARMELEKSLGRLEGMSADLTTAMETRETQRREALAKADMPIEGLAFGTDDKGKPMVTFGGVPFEQASTAEQLRASTAIAMRANPQLRVLRIKDGSLLDEDSLKLLGELATAEDFQLWIERVGTGGVGIVMENGQVAAKPEKSGKKAKPVPDEGTAGGTVETREQAAEKLL